eukprot:TRINITY_DN23427_c0_g1_i3.p1 TRINITY_DN23427_c0_g1~~TRINITY_DN23427_c0_g1_i3.p1  ORF type:complete len:760 (+),score=159.86 TRINITY_DN23427_c0_g1_i3:160-2439(+)
MVRDKSKTPCRFFAAGNCKYADKCRYLHNAQISDDVPSDSPPPCRFFAKGYCRNGDSCRFLHNGRLGSARPEPPKPKNSSEPPKPKPRPPRASVRPSGRRYRPRSQSPAPSKSFRPAVMKVLSVSPLRVAPLVRSTNRNAKKRKPKAVVVTSEVELAKGDLVEVTRGKKVSGLVAASEDPRAEMWQLVVDNGLLHTFPEDVDREVAGFVKDGLMADKLTDMREKAFVTIDNDDSMDLDQAMFIEPGPNGGFVVWYALADGAYFVRPGSALFIEALARNGSSYYLPGLCVPMLPRKLSEDLCSLNEDVDRRALVLKHRLDATGVCKETTVHRALIHSRAKLSYRTVQEHYDSGQNKYKGAEFEETLALLRTVGNLRRAMGKARGVVEYSRHRERLFIDPETQLLNSVEEHGYKSELYNEQISLLCNSEGAKILVAGVTDPEGAKFVQGIFRSQEAPSEQKREELRSFFAELAALHSLELEVWGWSEEEHLGDYLRRLHRLVDGTPNTPGLNDPLLDAILRAIDRQAMMCNLRAIFGEDPLPHHSLRVDSYARLSSPMRELIGCFTHKELLQWCRREEGSEQEERLDEAIRDALLQAGLRAKRIQRSLGGAVFGKMLDSFWVSQLHLDINDREEYHGAVLGMDVSGFRGKPPRVYVQVLDPFFEIKIALEDLNQALNARRPSQKDQRWAYRVHEHVGRSALQLVPEMPNGIRVETENAIGVGSAVKVWLLDRKVYVNRPHLNHWIFAMDVVSTETGVPAEQ